MTASGVLGLILFIGVFLSIAYLFLKKGKGKLTSDLEMAEMRRQSKIEDNPQTVVIKRENAK